MTHLHVTLLHLPRLMYMWHDSCTCDMTHLHVTWLIYTWQDSCTCNLTNTGSNATQDCRGFRYSVTHTHHSHMCQNSFACDSTHVYITRIICMSRHMTHVHMTWQVPAATERKMEEASDILLMSCAHTHTARFWNSIEACNIVLHTHTHKHAHTAPTCAMTHSHTHTLSW